MTKSSPPQPDGSSERRRLAIGSLIPNPRNNRIHAPEQLAMLQASIERFGQPRPVLARKANRMLIAGHGIWQVMRDLRLSEIDATLWDVDQATADEFLLADNRLTELSSADPERTRALLADVSADAYAALGFTAADIEAMFDEAGGHSLVIREIDTSKTDDQFWISVRGPLADQARALQRLKEVMADLPAIEVELGTVVL